MSIRILLLNTLMEAGGAQKAMLQLARGLAHRGHHVVVATMYDKARFIAHFEQEFGVAIIDLEMKDPTAGIPVSTLWRMPRGLLRLWRLLRTERIEVIQTFSHYSNIIGPMVAWLARVRVRISCQQMTLKGRSRGLLIADRLIANSFLVQHMVSCSEGTADFCRDIEGIRAGKLGVIYNAIDAETSWVTGQTREAVRTELGLGDNHRLVTVVARLHPQKGHYFLIEAVERLRERGCAGRVLLVGDGELRDSISQEIHARRLEDRISLLGARKDVPRILAASDLFVLPSLWEGLPLSVLEAMAVGLPVVATAVDGTPEAVIHGETGLLVPPRDSVALADAIEELLEDDARRSLLGANGRRRIRERFSLEEYVQRYEETYERFLS